MDAGESFGFEAMSSKKAINQLASGEISYVRSDSVVFVPDRFEDGVYKPFVLSAMPIPDDCVDWIAVSRTVNGGYLLDMHLFDIARDGKFVDEADVLSTLGHAEPAAYCLVNSDKDVDGDIRFYGDDEAYDELQALVNRVEDDNHQLVLAEQKKREAEERNKQIQKIGRGVLAVVSFLPLPQPLHMGVNFVANSAYYLANSMLTSKA